MSSESFPWRWLERLDGWRGWWLVLKAWRVEWGRRKGGGHICWYLMTTGPCLRSDWTIWTVGAQSPLLSFCLFSSFPPTYGLVGEPDSTGNVSGRVSRCSAQTSAPCASAQWAGMGNIGCLPPYPSYSISSCVVMFLFALHLLFPPEPSGVAPQIWGGSSWNPNCTIQPCIRGSYGK